jgi:hypothetical protein
LVPIAIVNPKNTLINGEIEMATVQQGNSAVTATSTVNDGGTAMNVGTSSVLDTRSLGTADVGVFGSAVVSGVNTEKAVDAGTFAYDNQTGLIMRVTETLATVSNDVLVSAADDVANARSIHQVSGVWISDETSAIRNGAWNAYSGEFSPATSGELVDMGVDAAANPTRSVPGELYYLQGGKTPVTGEYSSKNT